MLRVFRAAWIVTILAVGWAASSDACTGEAGGAFTSEPTLRQAPALVPEGLPRAGLAVASSEPTLVILVQFSDRAGSTGQAAWNGVTFGAAPSVRDYYQEVSYYVPVVSGLDLPPAAEASAPNNNGVAGWYTINYTDGVTTYTNHPENDIGDNWEWNTQASRWIAQSAVVAAGANVNYAAFDTNGNGFISASELHIIIVVAGYEDSYSNNPSPDSWRHHWSLVNGVAVGGVTLLQFNQGGAYSLVGELDPAGTIIEPGLICHEMGHDLGLPDLYDRTQQSQGIGEWGLMGSGDWCNTVTLGDSPAHLCPWSKIRLGWVAPTVVGVDLFGVSIPDVENNAVVYKLQSRNQPPGDYFLVENRQRLGYDQGLVRSGAASGLLIWHIDDYAWDQNDDETHKLVDLECADGLAGHIPDADDLDSRLNRGDGTDPWYLGNDTDFYTSSKPDNRDYRTPDNFNTSVEVRNISASGNPMTCDLKVGRVTYLNTQWYNANGQTGNFNAGAGNLRAYFHGWNCCGNVHVYERNAAGAWVKVSTWNFNVPRHASFVSGNEIRQQARQWTGNFRLTSYSLCGAGCDQPTDAGFFVNGFTTAAGGSSPGNPEVYAGWNIGFRDGLHDEFGYITAPMWTFDPQQVGVPLTLFPVRAGMGGVELLNLNFEVEPNVYWERMALEFTVDAVYMPGPLHIDFPEAEIPVADEWIEQPGDYQIDFGAVHTAGPVWMQLAAMGEFSWDWMNLRALTSPIYLVDPPDGALTSDDRPTVEWTELINAVEYQLQIDDDPDFETPEIDESGLTTTSLEIPVALADGRYYWRVRGRTDFGGWSDPSWPWRMAVDATPPAYCGTTIWPDTTFTGPFVVQSCVIDDPAGVETVTLYYRYDEGSWQAVPMTAGGVGMAAGNYEAEIPATSATTIDYYVEASDFAGNTSTDPAGAPGSCYHFDVEVGIHDPLALIPRAFALKQNRPNPFTPVTEITYALPRDSGVRLEIYNVLGQRVVMLVDEKQTAGYRTARWDGNDEAGRRAPGGIYFYRLTAEDFTQTRKMILIQ